MMRLTHDPRSLQSLQNNEHEQVLPVVRIARSVTHTSLCESIGAALHLTIRFSQLPAYPGQ